jgi:ribosomal protein S27AE
MNDDFPLVCPVCSSGSFVLKHEATYVYSYLVDSDSNAPGLKNRLEFLPFNYDNREQKSIKQYVVCSRCGTSYPCFFDHWDSRIGINSLRDAINAHQSLQ